MSAKKNIIIGCSIIAGLALIVFVIVVGAIIYVAQDPKGLAVTVEGGTEAKKGEPFELVIKVSNERSSGQLKVGDIDIADDYLKNFVVVSTDPPSKSSQHVPIVNDQSFTFDLAVGARQSKLFKFQLRPVATGVFRGDVQVYEGARSLTVQAQTEVK